MTIPVGAHGDDNTSRCSWPIARVSEVIPSKDGIIRKVKVVVANASKVDNKGIQFSPLSVLERPVQKLVMLFRP